MSQPAYTRLDVDERRRQLLELGASLFARHAYDELSMAQIAREAGISKALLYHYFPSKQAYFAATLEQAAAELAETTRPDAELPPVEQLAASLDAYLSWVERNADAYSKLIQSVGAVARGARDGRARPQRNGRPDPRRDRARAARRARRCAPPCAAGCGSWTAPCSTGSSTATWTARGCTACCSGRLLGAVTASRRAAQRADAQHDDRPVVAIRVLARTPPPSRRARPPPPPRRRRAAATCSAASAAPRRSARRTGRARRSCRRCRARACRPVRARATPARASGSASTPSSVPRTTTSSTVAARAHEQRIGMAAGGQAAHRTRRPRGRSSVAQPTVQNAESADCRRSASLRNRSMSSGRSSRSAIARSVWRASPVSTAAAVPLPATSPTATSQRPGEMSKQS